MTNRGKSRITISKLKIHIITLQQTFFSVNRFERPQQINQSKQALSNMLRQRHPLNQFMGPSGQAPGGPGPQANAYAPMQRPFSRQPMRQQHPSAMQGGQVRFYSTF